MWRKIEKKLKKWKMKVLIKDNYLCIIDFIFIFDLKELFDVYIKFELVDKVFV